jgi:hypothetical protein
MQQETLQFSQQTKAIINNHFDSSQVTTNNLTLLGKLIAVRNTTI